EVLFELTTSLPNIVLGLSLLILFSGPIGAFMKRIGLPVIFSRNGIILAQLIVNLPFAIKLTATAFRDVDPKLEKIAGLLGAGPADRFLRIVLPLSKNALISTFILIWSRALGEFGATLMLVGVTRMKTETLPAGIYLNVSVNDLSAALASAFLLLIISAAAHGIAALFSGQYRNRSRYVSF
ncbi:MAG: ABC transporter permease subunit, partial [Oscillospiraceae bacterium]|nr:ABC transporter permease subunit [Oscillospiraceae bacterium]